MKKRYLIPGGNFVCLRFLLSDMLILVMLLSMMFIRYPTVLQAADERDLYEEGLKFDSQGNLLMTTHDKKASGTVRYKTIGWTVREKSAAEGGGNSIRIRMETHGTTQTDPENPAYSYSYFICTKEEIYSKVGQASKEWQRRLFTTGGILYLDAIMTVIEHDRPQGYMDADGTLHGEVYTTSSGIMGARGWADPSALLTHFNKSIVFLGIPDLIDEPHEEHEQETDNFSYGLSEVQNTNQIIITALPDAHPEFDVKLGIPTGEQVKVKGKLQKYYYSGQTEHYYGTVAVPVEVTVIYTIITMTDDGPVTSTVSYTMTRYVNREYSYYRITDLDLNVLKNADVRNKALPEPNVSFSDIYVPDVSLIQDREEYLQIPTYHVSIHGGVLGEGGGVTVEEIDMAAERAAGEVLVRNDEFIMDGEVILDGEFHKKSAPKLKNPRGSRLQDVEKGPFTITHDRANGSYETSAKAGYISYFDKSEKSFNIKKVHPVIVHTPVTCKGGITDDIAHNQQVKPTGYFTLVLGREFAAAISTTGTHLEIPGYGTQDYKRYVKQRQICFPFEVYVGQQHIPANYWVDLGEEPKYFYLPVGVHEGDYTVRYRTLAMNVDAGDRDANEYLANLQRENYGAYDELKVRVVGRMYDLCVTDVVDYPRWKSVFHREDGSRNNYFYWVGHNNSDGEIMDERKNQGFAPILAGSHPYNPNAGAPGLGYRVHFELKTIGDMRSGNDKILLQPKYYYVSRDGRERIAVKLYQKKDLTEVYRPIVLMAANRGYLPVQQRNVSDAEIRLRSVQIWSGEYQLSPDLCLVDADTDLDDYIRLHGGRIRMKDPVFLRDGYLLVQFELIAYPSASDTGAYQNLCYVNRQNSPQGYCNMWELQGFLHHRIDASGVVFTFEDGDFLMFDTKKNLHSDYESWGTH